MNMSCHQRGLPLPGISYYHQLIAGLVPELVEASLATSYSHSINPGEDYRFILKAVISPSQLFPLKETIVESPASIAVK